MHQIWRFSACEFDDSRYELRVGGVAADVEVKPLEVLRQLLQHAGEVLTKDELLEAVWPGVMVVDGSLATAVSKLRKALGPDGELVVTVPRVGYRLAAAVVTQPAMQVPPVSTLELAEGLAVPFRPEWRLVRRLDPSASGEVWIAEHPKTHERRVFKFASDGVRLKGLKREVTIARLLKESFPDRPEFVRALEWNFQAEPYFVESEYAGPDLIEWSTHQTGGLSGVPLADRIQMAIDVAGAIAAVHEVGVLHKDLKPRNILVSGVRKDGTPQIRIADFGSAAVLAPDRLEALGITRLGFTQAAESNSPALTGTLMYIAPEILAGQSSTEATDVFAIGVLLYQLVAGDLRKPLAAGWENDIPDVLLRQDISEAADGDPTRRLATAAALADRLSHLAARREKLAEIEETRAREAVAAQRRQARGRALRWMAGAAAVVVVAVLVVWTLGRPRLTPVTPPPTTAVAVLPFQNLGTDRSIDFLQFAIPDEITTILSQVRRLSVRSFSRTRQFTGPGVEPQKAGEALKVAYVVTGHFQHTVDTWQITAEATDVVTGAVVWHETFEVPAASPVAMRTQLLAKTRGGLAPSIGALPGASGAVPQSDQAYRAFLEAESVSLDPVPNRAAIRSLEEAAALDPTYGPIWVELGRRDDVGARYDTNTSDAITRAEAAAERALALDRGDLAAGNLLTVIRLERGDLLRAYQEATDLVRSRPDNADAHFMLSYVLRFAGVLDDAKRECQAAFLIDPHTQTAGLRSCAVAFLLAGDTQRARDFIQLDFGSDWANALTIHTLLREGRPDDARRIPVPHIPQWNSYDVVVATLAHRPAADVATLAAAVRPSDDPETNYFSAAHLAYGGQLETALDLLRRAIDGHYCSIPAMDADPFFVEVRRLPGFAPVRAAAEACQREFRAGVTHAIKGR